MEAPCSYVGTPPIVGGKDTTQVGNILPVSLVTISNGRTPNAGICISNSRISIRAIIT